MNKEQVADFRARISACTACPTEFVCRTAPFGPRFGLGNADRPRLAILGINPPADPARALHGGWMLHYNTPEYEAIKTNNERKVRALVDELGLKPSEVYVTQGVKCATPKNETRLVTQHECSRRFLHDEINLVNPQVLLLMGTGAISIYAAAGLWRETPGEEYHTVLDTFGVHKYGSQLYRVIRKGRRVSTPNPEMVVSTAHPSLVGRFVRQDSWIEVTAKYIRDAWNEVE